MHTPRLLRFISLKYIARWCAWRCRSRLGPTHTSARVAGRVAHSTLIESAPRSARNRPATGPAQFVVTSMIRTPSSGGRRSATRAAPGSGGRASSGGVDAPSPTAGAGPRRRAGVPENLYGWPGYAMSPSRSHHRRASSCSSTSTPAPSTTGVTAIRSTCPNSTISATVLSAAHSATASKIRGMFAFHVGRSTVSPSAPRSGRSIMMNSSSFGTMRITYTQPSTRADQVVRHAREQAPVRSPGRHEPGVGGERRLQLADLDVLPDPAARPLVQAGERRDRHVGACMERRVRTRQPDRLAVGVAGEVVVAAHRPRDEVAARPAGVRAGTTERRDVDGDRRAPRPWPTADCHGDVPSVSTTSARSTHGRRSLSPAGTSERLPPERWSNRPWARSGVPPGGSTITTSAPRSARSFPANAAETPLASSSTSTPSSADAVMPRSQAPPRERVVSVG